MAENIRRLKSSLLRASFFLGQPPATLLMCRRVLGLKPAILPDAKKRASGFSVPKDDAIRAAIEAEGGHIDCEHPYTEAEAILDGVNKRLVADGHNTVSKTTLGRRISLFKTETKV
jgi:hypothetical protein